MNVAQTAYGQDDPADTPSEALGPAVGMVELARYWNRHESDTPLDEVRRARRLSAVLRLAPETSSPWAPREVLQVGTDEWTARALTRLGFRVETTTTDPVLVSSGQLFDLVLAPDALLPLDDPTWLAAVVNLSSLVRLGGRLVVSGAAGEAVHGDGVLYRAAAQYRALLGPRGFRPDRVEPAGSPGALLAWKRES